MLYNCFAEYDGIAFKTFLFKVYTALIKLFYNDFDTLISEWIGASWATYETTIQEKCFIKCALFGFATVL